MSRWTLVAVLGLLAGCASAPRGGAPLPAPTPLLVFPDPLDDFRYPTYESASCVPPGIWESRIDE